ncbi:MAG: MoxR family ATPase [Gemmataceae bacterium]|nr:MoxR family ATPase [Gemmataceae bacterium]
MSDAAAMQARAEEFRREYGRVFREIAKVVVGHSDIVHGILTCLFVGGHALLEGVPGLGKTLLVRTLSQVLDLKFSRIQFTPDLMPSDIIGTNIISEGADGRRAFSFQGGPVFAQIVLADEINRATPKTQSALLEAMQEKQVTVGGTVHTLESPFFVMATQNPIEQEGTYPLPEAQLDRFFFKLVVGYSTREEMAVILDRTTRNDWPQPERVMDGPQIQQWQKLVREVIVAPPVQDYAIRLVLATHPGGPFAAGGADKLIRCGASPRGAQALVLAAKVRALLKGTYNVGFEDVREACLPALRHRVLLSFEAQAENVSADAVLGDILKEVKERVADAPARKEAGK